MRWVPFEPKHVWEMEIDLRHNLDARPWLREAPEVLEELAPFSWSIENEGKILACGGKVPRTDGAWSWWYIATVEAVKHGVWITLRLRRHLDQECCEGIHYAHAVDDVAASWLQALGFKPDGEEFGMQLHRRAA